MTKNRCADYDVRVYTRGGGYRTYHHVRKTAKSATEVTKTEEKKA